MWIVRLALRLPYTFLIGAILIVIVGVLTIFRTPVDIFPAINIPVVSVVWTYTGISPQEMSQRIVQVSQRAITTTVSDIEHQESQSLSGLSVIKVFFQPTANIAAAVAQVTSICQTILRPLPPGISPPLIIQYNASNVPIIQMSLSSKTLSEQAINDLATSSIRVQLATVQGAAVPLPFGGKVRQIMIDIDSQALFAKGLSANDVVSAVTAQNLILPSGTAKMGDTDYFVKLNNSTEAVDALNNVPVKQINGTVIYMRDVAQVHDGFAVQTNVVRLNGRRGSLLSILKAGSASTLEVVNRVKQALPRLKAALPPELDIGFLFDQSQFVQASIQGVLKEGLIAAVLTALMILVFLGSWRSTLIVVTSIPLSILVSIIIMSALGQTLNIMTLGGLSLAVGILVDDATVEIENIHRNMGQGKPIIRAILDGAQQIATPALVATLSICIVFVPVTFLSGVAKYLFVPLAMAVVFAMLASYVLSRTVVPTMAHYLLKNEVDLYTEEEQHSDNHNNNNNNNNNNGHHRQQSPPSPPPPHKDFIWRQHEKFNVQFEKFRSWYRGVLRSALDHRKIVFVLFGAFWVSGIVLLPFVGQDFFPQVDGGQFTLHVRVKPGTRLETTEQIFAQVENLIRQSIPTEDLAQILDNIGIPSSGINLTYGYNGATIASSDGDILVSLKEAGKTFEYIKQLRPKLKANFPDYTFFFEPADIVTQILNFGLPAAVDIQISGPLANSKANYQIAKQIEKQVLRIPGTVDVHVQQVTNAPQLRIDVDRIQAQESGLTQSNVANNVLTSLSSSGQNSVNYWLDPKKGVSYLVAVQVPQYQVNSIDALNNLPINSGQQSPQLLSNLANITHDTTMQVVNDYNIQPVYDVYANTQDRDLGGVAGDINKIVAKFNSKLPRGSKITIRGQVQTMNSSFIGLGLGLVLAIVLVYCLMVVNFQTWLDPLIIMMALPSALAGIVWMLFISQTTLSVPSLMGAIMSIGVATSNSILMITFANERRGEGDNAYDASLAAGYTRLRPVLMTAMAMIIGMIPMSLGLGEGGEQNAPLGRAVIGGLTAATFATLLFVPVVYSIMRRKPIQTMDASEMEMLQEDRVHH